MSTKPLTPRQAQILSTLAALPDKNRNALITATGFSRQLLDRELERLEFRQLITRTRTGPDKRGVLQLSITMAGNRTVADTEKAAKKEKPNLVQPPSFRFSSLGAWPTDPGFYRRETRNGDIPSRGVAC